ncbi:unnamed protein product [Dovyalis caffra]|uniref:S-protein homolog n=1 Tax=Dovyalis caffra TaxID=77055 RepID=A0AAV1R860_9ROSI|nr:unnamed protein product [Dovyalis caffra]
MSLLKALRGFCTDRHCREARLSFSASVSFLNIKCSIFLLLLAKSITPSIAWGIWSHFEWNVRIVNELSNNKVMHLHCFTYNRDLGRYNLKSKAEFKFTFQENILGDSTYKCEFSWENKFRGRFDVFWEDKIYDRKHQHIQLSQKTDGSNIVTWLARDDGIYLREQDCYVSLPHTQVQSRIRVLSTWKLVGCNIIWCRKSRVSFDNFCLLGQVQSISMAALISIVYPPIVSFE